MSGQSVEHSGNNYDRELYKGNVDGCNISKRILGNVAIKLVAVNLEKYSNYKFICPQSKGLYYARNFPLMDAEIVKIMSGIRNLQLCVIVKGKVGEKTKPMVHALTLKLFYELS